VELAVSLTVTSGSGFAHLLAAAFFAVSICFVYRSFYGMRIRTAAGAEAPARTAADRAVVRPQ